MTRPAAKGSRLPAAASVGLALAVGWNVTNTGAVAGPLADEYGVRLSVVGLLATALFVTHFAAQIPGGSVIDRVGARPVGAAALALVAGANLLAAVEPDIGLAVAARLLAGLGTGAAIVAGSDLIRAAGGSAALQGLYGGGAMAGGGAALAIVPALDGALGWRAPYLGGAVLAGAGLAALAAAGPVPALRSARRWEPLRALAADRRLRALAAVHTASFGLSVVIGNWVVPLLERDGHGLRTAGLLGSLVLLGGLLTRPAGGWIATRRPASTGLVVGGSLVVLAAGVALLAAPLPLPLRALAAALAGLAAGIPFAPAFAGAQRARPDAPAAAVGFVNATATLAIVAATPLLGLAFAVEAGPRAGFLLVAAAIALAALAARGLGGELRFQPRDRR